MKILLINKYNYLKRGAERIYLDTKTLLEQNGHTVLVFSMHHPDNLPSPQSEYFVDYIETHEPGIVEGVKAFGRAVYSPQAAKNLERLILAEKPDVAHLHNIYHQISPSILPVLKKHNIPVVMTAHDYKLVCPGYQLNKNGVRCPRNILLHAVQNMLVRPIHHPSILNSILGNGAASVEWLIHKLSRVYEKNIDRVIVPSVSMEKQLLEYGWTASKITLLPHFTFMEPNPEAKKAGDFVLFAAQLSPEKGTDILIEVAKKLPSVQFVVAGGPGVELPELKNLQYLGHQSTESMTDLYRRARLLFAPSRFQESFGLSVLEASLQKTPSVVSSLGALSELVEEGKTGYVFDPSRPEAVDVAAELIMRIWANPQKSVEMGNLAYQKAMALCSPKAHYEHLLNIYLDAGTKKNV